MTKFKLRHISMASAMVMGLTMYSNVSVGAAAMTTDNIDKIAVDLENEYINVSKCSTKVWYSTDALTFNKSTGVLTKNNLNKWILAEDGLIDFSYLTKATTVYLTTNPTEISLTDNTKTKMQDFIAVNVPMASTLKVAVKDYTKDYNTGLFNFTITYGSAASDKVEYVSTATRNFKGTSKLYSSENVSEEVKDVVQVKKNASSQWKDLGDFFNTNSLENLLRKGTTLYFRASASNNSGKLTADGTNVGTYNIKSDVSDTSNVYRASLMASTKLKAVANAPAVTANYAKNSLKINGKMEYQVVKSLDDFNSSAKWVSGPSITTNKNGVTTTKSLSSLDVSDVFDEYDGDTTLYFATRTAAVKDKSRPSNVAFTKIVTPHKLTKSELKNDGISLVKNLNTGAVTITNTSPNMIYQYAVTSKATSTTKWKDIKVAKTKNTVINISAKVLADDKKESNKVIYLRRKATKENFASSPLVAIFGESSETPNISIDTPRNSGSEVVFDEVNKRMTVKIKFSTDIKGVNLDSGLIKLTDIILSDGTNKENTDKTPIATTVADTVKIEGNELIFDIQLTGDGQNLNLQGAKIKVTLSGGMVKDNKGNANDLLTGILVDLS